MVMNERNLIRIWKRRMLDVQPDLVHLNGWSQEQATMRSQRLNDATEKLHR